MVLTLNRILLRQIHNKHIRIQQQFLQIELLSIKPQNSLQMFLVKTILPIKIFLLVYIHLNFLLKIKNLLLLRPKILNKLLLIHLLLQIPYINFALFKVHFQPLTLVSNYTQLTLHLFIVLYLHLQYSKQFAAFLSKFL